MNDTQVVAARIPSQEDGRSSRQSERTATEFVASSPHASTFCEAYALSLFEHLFATVLHKVGLGTHREKRKTRDSAPLTPIASRVGSPGGGSTALLLAHFASSRACGVVCCTLFLCLLARMSSRLLVRLSLLRRSCILKYRLYSTIDSRRSHAQFLVQFFIGSSKNL